jgi:hypothetical protein
MLDPVPFEAGMLGVQLPCFMKDSHRIANGDIEYLLYSLQAFHSISFLPDMAATFCYLDQHLPYGCYSHEQKALLYFIPISADMHFICVV